MPGESVISQRRGGDLGTRDSGPVCKERRPWYSGIYKWHTWMGLCKRCWEEEEWWEKLPGSSDNDLYFVAPAVGTLGVRKSCMGLIPESFFTRVWCVELRKNRSALQEEAYFSGRKIFFSFNKMAPWLQLGCPIFFKVHPLLWQQSWSHDTDAQRKGGGL